MNTKMKSIVLISQVLMQEYVYMRSGGQETGKIGEGIKEKQVKACTQRIKGGILFHNEAVYESV